jgi:hypothetical protein
LGQGVDIFTINRIKMVSHRMYTSPIEVGNNEKGWHVKSFYVGKTKNISRFENGLIWCDVIHKSFIKQMTAFYNENDETETVVETVYSSSIAEFHYDEETGEIMADMYYEGDTINDIPVDMQYLITLYGVVEMTK